MHRRRAVAALACIGAAVASRGAFAQQGKVWRIGYLAARAPSTPSKPDAYFDAFTLGLRDLGYVEGKNLVIEWRFVGNYERLPIVARELVRSNVDVLATHGTPATQALQQATPKIPIVFMNIIDPVGSGLVSNLAKPGKNLTGTSNMNTEVYAKQMELLRATFPNLSYIAALTNPGTSSHLLLLQRIDDAAARLRLRTLRVSASTPDEIDRGFALMKRERIQALLVLTDSLFLGQRSRITELALVNRIPSMFSAQEDTVAGGLMSYGPHRTDSYRRAASYVDKIFKGAKPGDLPIQQPVKFEFVVNARVAKTIGVKIPESVLIRADEVIQ